MLDIFHIREMNLAIIVIRLPFGLLGTSVLIMLTLVVSAIFCVKFAFYAVLGKKKLIKSTIVPEFERYEGTHLIPKVWEWVFNPDLECRDLKSILDVFMCK
jgi:hypothetical protein